MSALPWMLLFFQPISGSWIKIVALEFLYIRFIFQSSITCSSVSTFVTDCASVFWSCRLETTHLMFVLHSTNLFKMSWAVWYIGKLCAGICSCIPIARVGEFLKLWPPSNMGEGPFNIYGHHQGCWNDPIFTNLELCTVCWAHFMGHHE